MLTKLRKKFFITPKEAAAEYAERVKFVEEQTGKAALFLQELNKRLEIVNSVDVDDSSGRIQVRATLAVKMADDFGLLNYAAEQIRDQVIKKLHHYFEEKKKGKIEVPFRKLST